MRVFMFPGQSSVSPAILHRALRMDAEGAELLRSACAVLDEDLDARFAGPAGVRPGCNRDVQLSVFLANHLHLRALQAAGVDASMSLGLSLGEYNHLVHIGAIGFEDALRLVSARGEAYDAGPRGMMAAVVGVEIGVVQGVVAEIDDVTISNFNGPTQHVIAGSVASVEAALEELDAHYAMSFVIERSVPMHCPRFESVAGVFEPSLRAATFSSSNRYFPNVHGRPRPSSTAADIVAALHAHVFQPVQWARSMDWIAAHHPEAVVVEVGPGRVLSDLARRGWPQLARLRTDEGDDPRVHVRTMAGRLHDAA